MAEIKITWSREALQDLEDIIAYISKDSEYYAKNFATKIINSIEILKSFPEIGRVVPEHNNSQLRELIYRNYRIVYYAEKVKVEIVTIFRGSKLLED